MRICICAAAQMLMAVSSKAFLLCNRVSTHTSLAGWTNDSGNGAGAQSKVETKTRRRRQHVPLLGPIPGAPPLLLGGEILLEQPTPLQWETIEEAVLLHEKYLNEEQSSQPSESSQDNCIDRLSTTTGIDAAPLVAVIDDFTGKRNVSELRRYATLAAVVGISDFSTSHQQGLDMTDESSFMESLALIGSARSPLRSQIRLVGVGRANLKSFFYKARSANGKNSGSKHGEDRLDTRTSRSHSQLEDGEYRHEDDDDGDERDIPITMAEFTLIRDVPISSTAIESQLGNKGARSVHCSPVHALAEMSRVVNRVICLHDDRRRLANGLKAAKLRLENANVFEDHDGIGETTARKEDDQDIIEEFLTKYNHADVQPLDTTSLASMENYGLNYYSAFSSIPQLTSVALEMLEPYYSSEVNGSEEHEMEVTSFVAIRALTGFCSPREMAAALQCKNTIERFNAAYDLMRQHKALLENMAEYASQDLRNCGEECTDLW